MCLAENIGADLVCISVIRDLSENERYQCAGCGNFCERKHIDRVLSGVVNGGVEYKECRDLYDVSDCCQKDLVVYNTIADKRANSAYVKNRIVIQKPVG